MLSSHRPTYNVNFAPLAPTPGISCHLPELQRTNTIGHAPDLSSTLHALQVTQHVLEMFRRTLSDSSGDSLRVLDRVANRLTKIAAELRKLAPE